MTERHIILHIGLHKCGSTFLQRVLMQNAPALAAAGLAYPHSGTGHPGNAAGAHEFDAAQIEEMFGHCQQLFLSHEDQINYGDQAQPFSRAVASLGASVEILCFVRPFPEYIFGDYSQQMKQHYPEWIEAREAYKGMSFEQFVGSRCRWVNPAKWLNQWRNALRRSLGEVPVTVASHRDIRETVEPLLPPGLDLDWHVPNHLTNPSLRAEDCDRLAAMIEDFDVPGEDIVATLKEALHHTGGPDAGRNEERIRWIEALFRQQIQQLYDQYGYDISTPASGRFEYEAE